MKLICTTNPRVSVSLALLAISLLSTPSTPFAGVAEVSALIPVSVPAKVGTVPGAKFIGLPVARPSLYEGAVTGAVAANTGASTLVTDANLTAAVLDALGIASVSTARVTDDSFATGDDQYVIEFTSGPNIGLVKTVSAVSAGGATVLGGLKSGLAVGTTYVLRKDWTLGSLFGYNNTAVTASGLRGGLVSGADHIGVVRNAKLELYHWTGSAWRPTSGTISGVAYEHIRIPLSGGFYFKRNTTSATTAYLTGVYRPHRLQSLLEGSSGAVFTVSTPNFKDTTLAETGLHRYVKSSTLVASADEIRIIGPTGAITSYFNAGSGSAYTSGFWNGTSPAAPSWRSTASGQAAGSANGLVIPAGSAVLIKKSGADSRLIGIDPAYTN